MATLTPFDQATLLTGITNPTLRGGICVALSDRWLAFMKESRLRTPEERLAALRAQAGSAMLYQDAYAWLRAEQGREFAVQLDGNDVPRTFGEGPRDGSLARADFNDGLAGQIANCCTNPLNRGWVAKEILTELWFLGH